VWKTLKKTEARKIFASWNTDEVPKPDYDDKDEELRNKLLIADKITEDFISEKFKSPGKKDYIYDLKFGLELYNILNNSYGFTLRDASNDEIWIYFSIKVIPDLVYKRWGLNEKRFFEQSRRIWLKTIWWYIHLSWNGTYEDTFNILKDFTTDEVVQLVERSGPNGYRIDLTREIMKQFSIKSQKQQNRTLFRKIMKLNTARLKIVEPALYNGGIKTYVEELIGYFDERKNVNNN